MLGYGYSFMVVPGHEDPYISAQDHVNDLQLNMDLEEIRQYGAI